MGTNAGLVKSVMMKRSAGLAHRTARSETAEHVEKEHPALLPCETGRLGFRVREPKGQPGKNPRCADLTGAVPTPTRHCRLAMRESFSNGGRPDAAPAGTANQSFFLPRGSRAIEGVDQDNTRSPSSAANRIEETSSGGSTTGSALHPAHFSRTWAETTTRELLSG